MELPQILLTVNTYIMNKQNLYRNKVLHSRQKLINRNKTHKKMQNYAANL